MQEAVTADDVRRVVTGTEGTSASATASPTGTALTGTPRQSAGLVSRGGRG